MILSDIKHKIAAVICLGGVFLWGVFQAKTDVARDYYQFWIVGEAVQQMPDVKVYDVNDAARIHDFFEGQLKQPAASSLVLKTLESRPELELVGTPLLYAVFAAVGTGNFDRDYLYFRLFSLIVFLVALFYLSQVCGLSWAVSIPFWLGATVFSWAFRNDIWLGNITMIQVSMCLGLVALSHQKNNVVRHGAVGFGWALCLFFKPTFITVVFLVLLYHLFQKSKRHIFIEVAGFLMGGVLAVVLPAILLGSSCTWRGWFYRAPDFLLHPYFQQFSFLYFFTGPYSRGTTVLWNVILGLVPIWMGVQYNKTSSQSKLDEDVIPISLGICWMLLGSPLVHAQYFVLMVIPVAVVLSAVSPLFGGRQRWGWKIAGLFGIALLLLPQNYDVGFFGVLFIEVFLLSHFIFIRNNDIS